MFVCNLLFRLWANAAQPGMSISDRAMASHASGMSGYDRGKAGLRNVKTRSCQNGKEIQALPNKHILEINKRKFQVYRPKEGTDPK